MFWNFQSVVYRDGILRTTGHQASLARVDLEAAADGEAATTTGPLENPERAVDQVDGEAGLLESPERAVDQVGMMDVVRGAAGPLESPGRVDINQDDFRNCK